MQGATRVADLKLLSKERWEAHVEAQAAEAAKTGAAFEAPPMPTPTAGALFNRPNPRDEKGEFVLPYVRSRDEFAPFRNERMWVDADGFHTERPENPKDWQQTRKYVPVSGKDWTGVRIASHMKYRIPNTSVVNKVGDIKSFLCCGYRLTAAQWIWCDFAYLNLTHHQPQTRYAQVAQLPVPHRAHRDDLRHAPLCLLALGPRPDDAVRAPHRAHLPHHADPHTLHDREQHLQVVAGLEPHQHAGERRLLPARQRLPRQLCVAHHRVVRDVGLLPLLGVHHGRL